MGTFWNKFAKLGCINVSSRRLKTVTYGCQKSADLDSDELGKSLRIQMRIQSP